MTLPPLAQLVKSHRKKSGLTQLQLAELAGIGKTVVFDIEHGKNTIQLSTLQKVLHVLNIKLLCKSPLIAETEIS
ncbi:MAG: type II toxin-antitoxin system Y4mF family antitoxin [Gammaproteobacteria bacterium]